MGRWSRKLAPEYVSWLGILPGVRWLDVGCGTGALTEAICGFAQPASVVGCDPAEPFVRYARENAQDSRASFVVAGAGSLPGLEEAYGSIASLFALNFISDPKAAIVEMGSLSTSRGSVSACVWDYVDGMEFLRYLWDVATEQDPGAREQDEGRRFPICRAEALVPLFISAGLSDVRCEAIEIQTEFADFDDYWSPLLGGTGPAPSYVAALGSTRRRELAQRLDEALPRRADGTIVLMARAWAVQGIVE